jgi:P4 family phage/plasmid primase-like protien
MDYTGQITAETLTTGRKTGKNWEIAGIRGKRLIIAPELEEGTRLDAAFVKKICSTDKITGEKKYKDPFDFEPSHTVALFTNHLPRVGSNDAGTWRRFAVIPFNAVIEGKKDIKNYADYLYRHAGGAILKWIIEGARKFIEAGYRIEPPEVVKKAIEAYRAQNDWLNNYIAERCEIDPKHKQKSGELYGDYRAYCLNTGDYTRSLSDFKAGLEGAGYTTRKTKTGAFVYGLQLAQDNEFWGVRPL